MKEKVDIKADECETVINYSRYHIGDWAELYTTDKGVMKRLEKFCEKHEICLYDPSKTYIIYIGHSWGFRKLRFHLYRKKKDRVGCYHRINSLLAGIDSWLGQVNVWYSE